MKSRSQGTKEAQEALLGNQESFKEAKDAKGSQGGEEAKETTEALAIALACKVC